MRKKAQAALEFLMTYGWAILLVIVVVGALYATGMLKPCRWTGPQVREFPLSEIKVEVVRITSDELVFRAYYQQAGNATLGTPLVSKIEGTADGNKIPLYPENVTVDQYWFTTSNPATFTIKLPSVSSGSCLDISLTLNYTKPGMEGTYTLASGRISGPVS